MESVAYILVLTMALAVIFFAIAFREPPGFKSKFLNFV
ncbi:MAG UNVERIFIED_CONTAM: photosystem II reaction center protein T [Microcystis novacekii LVE1205-3]|jgi:photosystem II PsbT protein